MPYLKIVFLCFVFLKLANAKFEQNPDFIQLEQNLSEVKTIEGEVIQTYRGEKMTAHFAVKLPSKFRIEYRGKTPYIMIMNGKTMTYYDKTLDQKSQIPTPKEMLILFETSIFSLFNPNINITNFTSNGKSATLKFTRKGVQDGGIITALFFKENDKFMIEKIEVENATEKMIANFKNVKINGEISDKLFLIDGNKIDAKFNF